MKKLLSSVFIMLLSYAIYSQSGGASSPSGIELPEIISPSPTAFQMTRYGDISVNESTGRISPSIPIYTYKAGRLSVPISLNYQGNGVKVDQATGWTGINWNLNAGGVITRMVRDQDDLVVGRSNRMFYSYHDINAMDFYNNPKDVEKISSLFHVGNIDSEVDLFNFSFAGYSGSFFLDKDMVPHLTKYDQELKIEFSVGQKSIITITTPDGTAYYFGGAYIESSRTIRPTAGGGMERLAQTGFYLYKIKNYYGDEIYLEYVSKDYKFETSISQIDQSKNSPFNHIGGTCPGLLTESAMGPSGYRKEEILSTVIEGGRFLQRISSNRNAFEVVFEHSDVNITGIPNSTNRTNMLKKLKVKKEEDGGVLMSTNFSYIFPRGIDSSERFFLSRVNFNDGREYRMYYNKPEDLPKRFSFSQDHLGYYNGKDNNTLLPRNTHPAYQTIYNYLADRSPDFKYATKGALEKIVYPTKGTTRFEYEPTYTNKKERGIERVHSFVYINDDTRTPENKNPAVFYVGGTRELNDLTLREGEKGGASSIASKNLVTQNIEVQLSNVKSTEHLDQHVLFALEVKNLITNEETSYIQKYTLGEVTSSGYDPYLKKEIFYYPIKDKAFKVPVEKDHSYEFRFKIIANSYQHDAFITANVSFPYLYELDSLAEAPDFRIKKIYTDAGGKVVKTKWYNYIAKSNYEEPKYFYRSVERVCCDLWYSDYAMVNLVSSSINTVYYEGVRRYSIVEVHSLGEEDRGFVRKYFMNEKDLRPLNLLAGLTETKGYAEVNQYQRENRSILNGTLIKEKYYSVEEGGDNNYQLIKEIDYSYNIDQVASISNNACQILYNSCTSSSSYLELRNLYLGMYQTYSNKVLLDSTVVKDYFYEGGKAESVVQRTKYSYGDYVGLPTEVRTSLTGSKESKVINHYISEEISPTGSIQEVLRASLKLKHNFSIPYKVETYKDAQKIREQHTVYKLFGNLVLPELVQLSKGDQELEDRLIYHSYDSKGNPTELSKKDGVHIVYLWGYGQTQPVAKIINARLSDIPSSLILEIQAQSNSENDRTMGYLGEEGALRMVLNKLREVPSLLKSQITTYTYDPLIGITSITDVRGKTLYYAYDDFNRLEFVKDNEGNILKENKYNYKK
ncbi:hypothetical protein [Tenacibaculum maritimum]|uniref:hypothetical protein n=1 Tax=Tenacibaculum maritimum TaxID=107401 RepID=UPI0012E5630A|nr:hypothetical protein [Tenacibaculum maritimum]CAA0232107.1 YD repeat-containing protein [Tenacibaculum maritimum]